MLIELGGEFDGIDEFGRTRLVTAVMNGELKTAKVKKILWLGRKLGTLTEGEGSLQLASLGQKVNNVCSREN